MTSALIFSGALAAGLWLIVMGQPLGRPLPSLETRLRRLTAQGRMELDAQRDALRPMFSSPFLERTMRPLLDDAGESLAALLRRLGIETGDFERRLALASPGMTPAQFRGQQLATGFVLFAAMPGMNAVGLHPFGPWPVWLWLAAFAVGFAAPSWQLNGGLRRRRAAVRGELPAMLDLFALAASAGLSPEQALVEASRQLEGVVAAGLRDVVREAGLGTAGYASGLHALAEREDSAELRALADAWRRSQEQGAPLGQAMLALAETARDRERTQLLEEGAKASVRMLFPIALFIFPVFLVVLLYPAGVELLGLGR